MSKYIQDLFLTNLTSIEEINEEEACVFGNVYHIVNAISNGTSFTDDMLDSITMEQINEASEMVYKLTELSIDEIHDIEPNEKITDALHEMIKVELCKGNIDKIKMSVKSDVLFF